MSGARQRLACLLLLLSVGSGLAERDGGQVVEDLALLQKPVGGQVVEDLALLQKPVGPHRDISLNAPSPDADEELAFFPGLHAEHVLASSGAAPQKAARADVDPCSPRGQVWRANAGGYSCGSRIEWLSKHALKPLEAARRQVAQEFPKECGVCACWMAVAAGHACGARIEWLQDNAGVKTLAAAGAKVAAEFPSECGPCSPRSPISPPRGTVSLPPVRSLRVGVGFSLDFMERKLDPKVAARKLAAIGVRAVRTWNYHASELQGLYEAGIHDVLVGMQGKELPWLAQDASLAKRIAGVLEPFHRQGMRLRVAVGNEPLAAWENRDANHHNEGKLVPAVENMLQALEERGMHDVTVTVPFFGGILGRSYPPAEGAFSPTHEAAVRAVAGILHRTGSEFTIHQYPWFARKFDPWNVPLDLAVGRAGSNVHGRHYPGLLPQMVAAVRAALGRLDGRYQTMPLTIGETGWPSAGHGEATLQNACDFARNAIHAATRTDYPMDPHLRTVYLFEAFDERKKANAAHGGSSRETENNFGLFYDNGTPKCPGLTFP